MNKLIKFILAATALVGFASCASQKMESPMPTAPPPSDGAVYSDK